MPKRGRNCQKISKAGYRLWFFSVSLHPRITECIKEVINQSEVLFAVTRKAEDLAVQKTIVEGAIMFVKPISRKTIERKFFNARWLPTFDMKIAASIYKKMEAEANFKYESEAFKAANRISRQRQVLVIN